MILFFRRNQRAKRYMILAMLVFAGALVVLCIPRDRPVLKTTGHNTVDFQIIVDAGHGGFDGGAVSASGILEKDLNLQIAKQLQLTLLSKGYNVVMTRESDVAICNEGDSNKKSTDLKNRVNIANSFPNAIFVSIHMNNFTDSQYSGTQTFYSKNNENSKVLADAIQTSVKANLQPDNNREIKAGDSGIYILKKIAIPAVIVECGFLSNAQECINLTDPNYQKSLTDAIVNGIESYISMTGQQVA